MNGSYTLRIAKETFEVKLVHLAKLILFFGDAESHTIQGASNISTYIFTPNSQYMLHSSHIPQLNKFLIITKDIW